MSRRKTELTGLVSMATVWEAVAHIERDHRVHIHFAFRRDSSIRRCGFGRLCIFVRRASLGTEYSTVHDESITYPTPMGESFESILLMLVHSTGCRLDEMVAKEASVAQGLVTTLAH